MDCAPLNCYGGGLCPLELLLWWTVPYCTVNTVDCALLNCCDDGLCPTELLSRRTVPFWTVNTMDCALLDWKYSGLCPSELLWWWTVPYWTVMTVGCALLQCNKYPIMNMATLMIFHALRKVLFLYNIISRQPLITVHSYLHQTHVASVCFVTQRRRKDKE